jgi:hypothetical protein
MAKRRAKNQFHRPALQAEIEAGITLAVQRSDPECAKFVWAFITKGEKTAAGALWTIRGVKYGRAPREKCDAVLAKVTARMQTQFVIAEPTRKL